MPTSENYCDVKSEFDAKVPRILFKHLSRYEDIVLYMYVAFFSLKYNLFSIHVHTDKYCKLSFNKNLIIRLSKCGHIALIQ